MKEEFEIKTLLFASASEVYKAWLDSSKHSEMTGGEASCSNKVGASFSAWDGYITGKNIALLENEEIIQSWRTSEFNETDEDSELSIKFNETRDGCELIIFHSNIPEGQTQYEQGWREHYFEPMQAYFNAKE